MFLVFLTLFGVVLWLVGWERTLEVLTEVGPPAVAAVGLTLLLNIILQATAWSVLSRTINHRIPFRTLLAATAVGQAANTLTPSTYVGGEALRVLYVGRKTGLSYTELSGTVLLAKYLEMLSFIIFFGLCALASMIAFGSWLFLPPYTPIGVSLLAVTVTISIFGVLLMVALYRHWTPVTHLVRLVWRWWPKSQRLARLSVRARRMEQQVSEVFGREKASAGLALMLLMMTHLAMLIRPLLFFMFVHGTDIYGAIMMLFVIGQSLQALPLTPAGAGTFDGGMIGAFILIGVPEAQGMAYLFSVRIWDAAMIATGLTLAVIVGRDLVNPQVARARLIIETNEASAQSSSRDVAEKEQEPPAHQVSPPQDLPNQKE